MADPRYAVRMRGSPWARRITWAVAAALVWSGVLDMGVERRDSPIREVRAEDTARAWLGVQMSKKIEGAIVAERVIRSSPAHKGGLRDADLLVSIDGVAVESAKQVIAHVAKVGVGKKTTVRVRRGGVERDHVVTLEAFPGADAVLKMDKVGTFAPAWQGVTTVKGSLPDSLTKLRGNVVLLDFWASWCVPCRFTVPELSDLQDRLGAQGLRVVGLTGDPVPRATKAADALDMRYAVGSDDKDETSAAYGVQALPTMFVIDKRGVIRDVLVGFDPADKKPLEALLVKLLAEPAPAP